MQSVSRRRACGSGFGDAGSGAGCRRPDLHGGVEGGDIDDAENVVEVLFHGRRLQRRLRVCCAPVAAHRSGSDAPPVSGRHAQRALQRGANGWPAQERQAVTAHAWSTDGTGGRRTVLAALLRLSPCGFPAPVVRGHVWQRPALPLSQTAARSSCQSVMGTSPLHSWSSLDGGAQMVEHRWSSMDGRA